MNKYIAEFIGTFFLILVGVGTAMYDGVDEHHLGISLAFGFTLLVMAYALGPVSGCHINPAVTIGVATAGRLPWSQSIGYVIAQVLGASSGFGTLVTALILSGKYNPSMAAAVANGYGDHSALGVGAGGAFLIEALVTFILVFTVLAATSSSVPAGFAPIPIGLALTIGNFLAIPVTNASINPARSIAPALYTISSTNGWALSQLWLFIAAPIAGGIIAAVLYNWVARRQA